LEIEINMQISLKTVYKDKVSFWRNRIQGQFTWY